jgi:hypothetical protein
MLRDTLRKVLSQFKTTEHSSYIEVVFHLPLLRPLAMISIGFGSDEIILKKLRERLRRITDEELNRVREKGP